MLVVAFGNDHLAFELRQIFLDRVLDAEPALVRQHHHRRASHRLGHRGDPKQTVRPHRLVFCDIGKTDGGHVEDFIFRRHQRHRAGQRVIVHKRLQRTGDTVLLTDG